MGSRPWRGRRAPAYALLVDYGKFYLLMQVNLGELAPEMYEQQTLTASKSTFYL